MQMPSDPFILLSMVNMKLRDSGYTSPAELCAAMSWDLAEMERRLAAAGFSYLETANQYR